MNLSNMAYELSEKFEFLRRYQRIVYAAILIIVGLQLFYVLLLPKLLTYQARRHHLLSLEKNIQEKRRLILDKQNVEKEVARRTETLEEKKTLIFSESDFNEFSIHRLSELAEAHGLKMMSVLYKPQQALSEGVISCPMSLKLEGDYAGFMGFIAEIESLQQVVKVNQLAISTKSLRPFKLSLDMEIQGYMIKDSLPL
jgi:Tfp pilus assembly protein PilO